MLELKRSGSDNLWWLMSIGRGGYCIAARGAAKKCGFQKKSLTRYTAVVMKDAWTAGTG